MFTGIVQTIGTVIGVDVFDSGDRRLSIDIRGIAARALEIGASLCVSGACLTIVESTKGVVAMDVSARTLADTVLGAWTVGQRVNLEPALAAGDALGGHFVMGHVDGAAEVLQAREDGRSVELVLSAPGELRSFIAPKGSVALDGVSLTVNDVSNDSFSVNLVPHTLRETTLSDCRAGSRLNLEIDIIARYVARLKATS
ncbi:MAG: riboflavin synthase [Gammaproteobacteria bacterium]|nr:riboflavin synthase [Gammaproteobacteria bacterium]MYE48172.1 riboflavin synthase [Gammaproteobacteria bacterium]MYF66979.1 riboflavin synthase [Gammaproteobacteria bacterium]MYK36411.1 riboflavin synthase [Gammaproteobacteria bacterium]